MSCMKLPAGVESGVAVVAGAVVKVGVAVVAADGSVGLNMQ